MFDWVELDAIRLMDWGMTNQRPRDNCLLVVEKDALAALEMLCGKKVSLSFFSINLSFC